MKYKRSSYNVEVDKLEDGKRLMYNTFTGMYGVMDEKTYVIYSNAESLDCSAMADEESLNAFNTMKNAGFITNSSHDELGALKLWRNKANHSEGEWLQLTIAPTMDCNMACPYCYEKKKDIRMTDETADKLIGFVLNRINAHTYKGLEVDWYGGEPLLEKDRIYSLSKKFIEICNEKGIDYTADIITNGILLDHETAKRLHDDCKVSFAQITIDGIRETHNARRLLLSGEDSFGIIVDNIDKCKDIIPISIRINVDETNLENVLELVQYFENTKGWGDNPSFYLAPVEKYGDDCLINNSDCAKVESFANLDFKVFLMKYGKVEDHSRSGRQSKSLYPKRKTTYCGATSLATFVVDPDGYLYTCWNNVGITGKSIGNVSDRLFVSTEYSKWLFLDYPEKCEKCTYLPICQGGCPYFILEHGEPNCRYTLHNYKDKLKLAYQEYIAQKRAQAANA